VLEHSCKERCYINKRFSTGIFAIGKYFFSSTRRSTSKSIMRNLYEGYEENFIDVATEQKKYVIGTVLKECALFT
jgi:hypothetical protein